jgi:hypothetical protein
MRVLLVVLLWSCTPAGKLTAGLGASYVVSGTALLATGDETGDAIGAVTLMSVGAWFLLGALALELSHDGEHAPASAAHWTYDADHGDDDAGSDAPSTAARTPRPRAVDIRCSGSCSTQGSTGRDETGATVDTRCSFGDCTKHGWTTTSSSGTADSRCSFGDCTKHGWTTTSPSGTADTRCSFGDCSTHGWTTTESDGGRTDTRCNFGDCAKHGWTSATSDGRTVSCSCRFGDCERHGVECR